MMTVSGPIKFQVEWDRGHRLWPQAVQNGVNTLIWPPHATKNKVILAKPGIRGSSVKGRPGGVAIRICLLDGPKNHRE